MSVRLLDLISNLKNSIAFPKPTAQPLHYVSYHAEPETRVVKKILIKMCVITYLDPPSRSRRNNYSPHSKKKTLYVFAEHTCKLNQEAIPKSYRVARIEKCIFHKIKTQSSQI